MTLKVKVTQSHAEITSKSSNVPVKVTMKSEVLKPYWGTGLRPWDPFGKRDRDALARSDYLIRITLFNAHAKTSFHPFVFRMRLRANAPVFCRFRHVANLRLERVRNFSSALIDSYDACFKNGRCVSEQPIDDDFCLVDGREFYRHNDPWSDHGLEIWPQPQGLAVLSGLRNSLPDGVGVGSLVASFQLNPTYVPFLYSR